MSMLIPLPGMSLPTPPTFFTFRKPFSSSMSSILTYSVRIPFISTTIARVTFHPYYHRLYAYILVYTSWIVNPYQLGRSPTMPSFHPSHPPAQHSVQGRPEMHSSTPCFHQLNAVQCRDSMYLVSSWIFVNFHTILSRDFPLKNPFSWATVEASALIKGWILTLMMNG